MIPLAIRKAAPALPAKTRKAFFALIRKVRSATQRQWIVVGIAFVALMAAGPIWFVIYDLVGRKAWKDYEAAERARGAKLYVTDFPEPSVSDEDNFATLPIFKNSLNIRQRLPEFPRGKPGRLAAPEIGAQFEAEIWRAYFAKAGWIDTPSKDVGGDLRLALAPYDDALNELSNGMSRPHCSFNVPWAPNPYQTPHPCAGVLARAIPVAGLRAHVFLFDGDSVAALRDLSLIMGIRHRLAANDFRLPMSIRSKLARYEPAIIYEGLSRHVWSAEQLRQIIELLEVSDPLRDLANHVEMKRAMTNGACEWVLSGNVPGTTSPILLDPTTWFENIKVLRTFSGIVRRNQMIANRHYTALCNRIDLDSGVLWGGCQASIEREGHYYSIAAQTAFRSPNIRRQLASATWSRLASAACALELYYQKHSVYPRDLADLVPDYLPTPPHEPTSKDGFVYYSTDDGRYRLYSRGVDGEDYGGRMGYYYPDKHDYDFIDIPWSAPPPR